MAFLLQFRKVWTGKNSNSIARDINVSFVGKKILGLETVALTIFENIYNVVDKRQQDGRD